MKGPLILYSVHYFDILIGIENGITNMLSRIISDTGIKEIVIVPTFAIKRAKLNIEIMLFDKINDDLDIKLNEPVINISRLVQKYKENNIVLVSDTLTNTTLKAITRGQGNKNLYIYSPVDGSYTKITI